MLTSFASMVAETVATQLKTDAETYLQEQLEAIIRSG